MSLDDKVLAKNKLRLSVFSNSSESEKPNVSYFVLWEKKMERIRGSYVLN